MKAKVPMPTLAEGAQVVLPPILGLYGFRRRRPLHWRRGGISPNIFYWCIDPVTTRLYIHRQTALAYTQFLRSIGNGPP